MKLDLNITRFGVGEWNRIKLSGWSKQDIFSEQQWKKTKSCQLKNTELPTIEKIRCWHKRGDGYEIDGSWTLGERVLLGSIS